MCVLVFIINGNNTTLTIECIIGPQDLSNCIELSRPQQISDSWLQSRAGSMQQAHQGMQSLHSSYSRHSSRPPRPCSSQRQKQGLKADQSTLAATKQAISNWHDVDQALVWRGDEEAALSPDSPVSSLTAPWKVMLLSDGSVTRHLQLLTGKPIQVECLCMDKLSEQQEHQPPQQALQIPGPLVQRQVLLWSQSSPRVPLVYAASWWASDSVDRYLADKDLPIWVSLAKGHLELYREIQTVAVGCNPQLESIFGCTGPLWSRQYLFWHQGKPLTLIHEVFSNGLERHLGPQTSNGFTALFPPGYSSCGFNTD